MNTDGFKRKLSAILSADVVGYSRLMSEDDGATVQTLTGHREMMSALIEQYQGRVVDSPGDNLLAEFESVTQAVNCSVEIQREMAERNAELPDDRKMEYRIGVNLGDVIVEGDRIYGDGVNIAARLESLAEPGGICISGFVYNQIKNRLKLEYESMGEQTVKNIQEPVPVYRVLSVPGAAAHRVIKAKKNAERSWRNRIVIGVAALIVIVAVFTTWNFNLRRPSIEPASVDRMAYPLPDKPSIAVLPFDNMSGDPEQDYIGDGLSENIISALSVSSEIFVIARNTTFTYKDKSVNIKQVAEDLGVQYVLEGSIQKSGNKLRVTAQLIDALTGHHLWSEVYDRKMKDFFDLQDEITRKILVSLHVELRNEDFQLVSGSTNNLEALKHFTKADELFLNFNPEDNAKAQEHLEAALILDPEYVAAYTALANTHMADAGFGWSDNPFKSRKRAFELVQQALKIDEENAHAHSTLGKIYLQQRQYEKAIAEGKRAITLSPNFSIAYAELAGTMKYSGQFEESIIMMKKAFRLSPNLPNTTPFFLWHLADSYFFLGRYEEALEVCEQVEKHALSSRKIPMWIPLLTYSAVYQELGREEESRAYMAEALKVNPKLSLQKIKMSPFKNPAHLQRALDAFRKAGMPEKAPRAVP